MIDSLSASRTAAGFTTSLLVLALAVTAPTAAPEEIEELAPTRFETNVGVDTPPMGRFSERTLTLGLIVDRYEARLDSFTVKPRPLIRSVEIDAPRAYQQGRSVQLEVVLLGSDGRRHTRRVDIGRLCLSHDPSADPHVAGDTVLLHRDAVLVELPEVPGFDTVDVAYYETSRGGPTRTPLGRSLLDRARFAPAGGPLSYSDLAIARPSAAGAASPATRASTALWPEMFGDSDIYRVYGDEAEAASRVNIVIVPDGYEYSEKALMEQHADEMVAYFRGKTPIKEHDRFINYTLVYAYSANSGTDQCDCGIVVDTAMGTRFPNAGDPCGGSGNRCLFYGGGCDVDGMVNIIAAELRAPARDESIVMVNTPRYGGCGGGRAVYSAGNPAATDVALHELGHSLGGLADEYGGNAACGFSAGEINTSLNRTKGSWPEWAPELGPPSEGGQYYNECIYRPLPNCEMRSLYQPFCPVCNQHWALTIFGHPRVAPTAPLAGQSTVPATVFDQVPTDFSVTTRLAGVGGVTDALTWTIDGPGFAEPTVVANDVAAYSHTFDQPGDFSLSCEIVADTNFVKPLRYGANVDTAVWAVHVDPLPPPPEISAPGALIPLRMLDRETLSWEDGSAAGVLTYNLYRGALSQLDGTGYGDCLQANIGPSAPGEPVEFPSADAPPASTGWFYLVTGENPLGEGPLGRDSDGSERPNLFPCP